MPPSLLRCGETGRDRRRASAGSCGKDHPGCISGQPFYRSPYVGCSAAVQPSIHPDEVSEVNAMLSVRCWNPLQGPRNTARSGPAGSVLLSHRASQGVGCNGDVWANWLLSSLPRQRLRNSQSGVLILTRTAVGIELAENGSSL